MSERRLTHIPRMTACLAGLAIVMLCAMATVLHYHHHDCHGHVCLLLSVDHENSHCSHCDNHPDDGSENNQNEVCGLRLYQFLADENDEHTFACGEWQQTDVVYLLSICCLEFRCHYTDYIKSRYRGDVCVAVTSFDKEVNRRGPPMERDAC